MPLAKFLVLVALLFSTTLFAEEAGAPAAPAAVPAEVQGVTDAVSEEAEKEEADAESIAAAALARILAYLNTASAGGFTAEELAILRQMVAAAIAATPQGFQADVTRAVVTGVVTSNTFTSQTPEVQVSIASATTEGAVLGAIRSALADDLFTPQDQDLVSDVTEAAIASIPDSMQAEVAGNTIGTVLTSDLVTDQDLNVQGSIAFAVSEGATSGASSDTVVAVAESLAQSATEAMQSSEQANAIIPEVLNGIASGGNESHQGQLEQINEGAGDGVEAGAKNNDNIEPTSGDIQDIIDNTTDGEGNGGGNNVVDHPQS